MNGRFGEVILSRSGESVFLKSTGINFDLRVGGTKRGKTRVVKQLAAKDLLELANAFIRAAQKKLP